MKDCLGRKALIVLGEVEHKRGADARLGRRTDGVLGRMLEKLPPVGESGLVACYEYNDKNNKEMRRQANQLFAKLFQNTFRELRATVKCENPYCEETKVQTCHRRGCSRAQLVDEAIDEVATYEGNRVSVCWNKLKQVYIRRHLRDPATNQRRLFFLCYGCHVAYDNADEEMAALFIDIAGVPPVPRAAVQDAQGNHAPPAVPGEEAEEVSSIDWETWKTRGAPNCFQGQMFGLAGTFRDKRSQYVELLEHYGGSYRRKIGSNTNYFVIGRADREWRNSGERYMVPVEETQRYVAATTTYKDTCTIIDEEQFFDLIAASMKEDHRSDDDGDDESVEESVDGGDASVRGEDATDSRPSAAEQTVNKWMQLSDNMVISARLKRQHDDLMTIAPCVSHNMHTSNKRQRFL